MTITINFLGTAGQVPTTKRNHSAILLTFNEENILIDCGEGTQTQFRKAKLNPGKITRILISHFHGDHILGIPGILSTLALNGYNKTLYIYGPKGSKKFIHDLLQLFNFRREYEIKVEEVTGKFLETKDFFIEAKSMTHGIPCNAYSFSKIGHTRIDREKLKKSGLPSGPILQTLKEGKNIAYNGKKYLAKDLTYKEDDLKISIIMDTSVNKEIAPFVKNSDLIISEASFDSQLEEHAKEHQHLTAKQAGEIAKKSKSKRLILTHISQRYENKLKELLDDAKTEFENTTIAKDLEIIEI